MSDYPMLISNKLHSFRNFYELSFIGTIKFCPVYQKGISLIFRKLYCKRRGSAGQG